jgi:hypothetical protein
MVVLPVAAVSSRQPPSILFKKPNELSDLHTMLPVSWALRVAPYSPRPLVFYTQILTGSRWRAGALQRRAR